MLAYKLELPARVRALQEEIARAALRAGRKPEEITLVAATKTQEEETIRAAVAAGITVCGENRVQEMLAHLEQNAYAGARLHFIGHLQTNKVRQVVGRAELIQSVGSIRLAEEIARQALRLGIVQDILLEVNIGREGNKSGALPEELWRLAEQVLTLSSLRLRGLMCIPPAEATKEANRHFFARTYQLFIDMRSRMGHNDPDMDCLSMGMSGDFAMAVEEGATMVRVGQALFGPRSPRRML